MDGLWRVVQDGSCSGVQLQKKTCLNRSVVRRTDDVIHQKARKKIGECDGAHCCFPTNQHLVGPSPSDQAEQCLSQNDSWIVLSLERISFLVLVKRRNAHPIVSQKQIPWWS